MITKSFWLSIKDITNLIEEDVKDIKAVNARIEENGDIYIDYLVETEDGKKEFKEHAKFVYKIPVENGKSEDKENLLNEFKTILLRGNENANKQKPGTYYRCSMETLKELCELVKKMCK